MVRASQTLRDAAILVALVLLATSVRVTALPELPIEGPRTEAATAKALPAVATPQPASSIVDGVDAVEDIDIATDCRELSRLTVLGDKPDKVVVIEVEIDPRLRSALGLCPATDSDPRPVPADKA